MVTPVPYFPPCPECGGAQVGHNTGTGAIDAPLPWCPACSARAHARWKALEARRRFWRWAAVATAVILTFAAPQAFNLPAIRSGYSHALLGLVALLAGTFLAWPLLRFQLPLVIWDGEGHARLRVSNRLWAACMWLEDEVPGRLPRCWLALLAAIAVVILSLWRACAAAGVSFPGRLSDTFQIMGALRNRTLWLWCAVALGLYAILLLGWLARLKWQAMEVGGARETLADKMNQARARLPIRMFRSPELDRLGNEDLHLSCRQSRIKDRAATVKVLLAVVAVGTVAAGVGALI